MTGTVAKPLFLQAFDGTNARVPVWFMRQAGRYLSQYRALREKYSLEAMFTTPDLAAEVTCQPVGILNVDAAILFADILTLPAAMGASVRFDNRQGPVIETIAEKKDPADVLYDFEHISHIEETIRLVRQRLSAGIPLIGFAGGPFTVLTYLIEGGSSVNFAQTFRFLEKHRACSEKLMETLTRNTVRYLNLQKKAGAAAFQLFDSWAGILRPADFARWVLPFVRRIFEEVDLPSIYFVRNCAHLLALMDQSEADFLSVDHTVVLGHHTIIGKTKKGIQGNLFNGLLYADDAIIEKEVRDVLIGGVKHGRYIFNLSHGIFPDVDPNKLKSIVEQVHAFDFGKEKQRGKKQEAEKKI